MIKLAKLFLSSLILCFTFAPPSFSAEQREVGRIEMQDIYNTVPSYGSGSGASQVDLVGSRAGVHPAVIILTLAVATGAAAFMSPLWRRS